MVNPEFLAINMIILCGKFLSLKKLGLLAFSLLFTSTVCFKGSFHRIGFSYVPGHLQPASMFKASVLANLECDSQYPENNKNIVALIMMGHKDHAQARDILTGERSHQDALIDASEEMMDVVLAQELYARRYIILGTSDVWNTFLEKKMEFEHLIDRIERLQEYQKFPIKKIAILHQE